jgi:hypothetical protein
MLLTLWGGPREFLYVSICKTLNVAASRGIPVYDVLIKWITRLLPYKIVMYNKQFGAENIQYLNASFLPFTVALRCN